MNLIFLGTGTSFGVPQIGCDCAVCRSSDPRNRRTRCAVLVRVNERTILIDTPPDLREQLLREHVRRLDAVLITHGHADHLHGIDDLRAFSIRSAPVEMYADAGASDHIRRMFDYIFVGRHDVDTLPQINLHAIDPGRPFTAAGLSITPVPVLHAEDPVLGFRIGGLAYVTDCSEIPDASMELLRGLDVLVLGALRYRPHRRHKNIPQSLEVVRALKPKRTYFTHLTHEVDHQRLVDELPAGVEPAFDGLVVTL